MTTAKGFMERTYRLKKNPFGTRVDLVAPMAGRKEAKEIWTAVVERRKGQEGNSLNFIVGDYGLGKSFTLYKIQKQLRSDRTLLPLYLKFLPEDPIQRFGLDFIQRIFRELPASLTTRKVPTRAFDRLARWDPAVGTVLAKFFQGDELAQAYLGGERQLTARELQELGTRRKMASTEAAKDFLLGLLYIVRNLRIVTVVFLIDEVEYVFSQMRGARIANVFNTLRDLYDLPQAPKALDFGERLANVIFFFGISQAGWQRLNELERREQREGGPIQPLLDRREEVIELQALNESEARELIELRLRYNRTKGTVAGRPLIPYTEDFVKYVYRLTRGNPRHVVERCDLVLEDGLRAQINELNEAFARESLASHGLATEPA